MKYKAKIYKRFGAMMGSIIGVLLMIIAVCLYRPVFGAVVMIVCTCIGIVIGNMIEKKKGKNHAT